MVAQVLEWDAHLQSQPANLSGSGMDKVLDQDETYILLVSGWATCIHAASIESVGDKGLIGQEIDRTQVTATGQIVQCYFVIPAPKQPNPLD